MTTFENGYYTVAIAGFCVLILYCCTKPCTNVKRRHPILPLYHILPTPPSYIDLYIDNTPVQEFKPITPPPGYTLNFRT